MTRYILTRFDLFCPFPHAEHHLHRDPSPHTDWVLSNGIECQAIWAFSAVAWMVILCNIGFDGIACDTSRLSVLTEAEECTWDVCGIVLGGWCRQVDGNGQVVNVVVIVMCEGDIHCIRPWISCEAVQACWQADHQCCDCNCCGLIGMILTFWCRCAINFYWFEPSL